MEEKSVIAVVNNNGSILLGKKIDAPDEFLSGQWHIPGGKIESGESLLDGLKREIKEEAGIDVAVTKHLCTFTTPKGTLVEWYECQTSTLDVHAGSDLIDVKWVPKNEVVENCFESAISLWPKEIMDYFKE